MPFNMVFGLDAILSMEFLIPTLRVAKELNWMGHKLLERVEDLANLFGGSAWNVCTQKTTEKVPW